MYKSKRTYKNPYSFVASKVNFIALPLLSFEGDLITFTDLTNYGSKHWVSSLWEYSPSVVLPAVFSPFSTDRNPTFSGFVAGDFIQVFYSIRLTVVTDAGPLTPVTKTNYLTVNQTPGGGE